MLNLKDTDGTLAAVRDLLRKPTVLLQTEHQYVFKVEGLTNFFNMNLAAMSVEDEEEYVCGTACCIGGTAWVYENGTGVSALSNADRYVGQFLNRSADAGLSALYYPRCVNNWDAITPAEAADAIDNYLNGKAEESEIWEHVLLREDAN
jgi:hypothetical protein